MYFHGSLIISYVHDPDTDSYFFQLAGGEVCKVSKEAFFAHWQEYRALEEERALEAGERYRPLPVNFTTVFSIQRKPVNTHIRRKRKSAYLNLKQEPLVAHG